MKFVKFKQHFAERV